MSDTIEKPLGDDYFQAVEHLLDGEAHQATQLLQPLVDEGHPDVCLCLGKAFLELRDGASAARLVGRLLQDPPEDPGLLSYLHLLAASAYALQGDQDSANGHLDAALKADPRMEHAVRMLRRRVEKGRPPLIRF